MDRFLGCCWAAGLTHAAAGAAVAGIAGVDDFDSACVVQMDGDSVVWADLQTLFAWIALDAKAEVWLDAGEADADSGLVDPLERAARTGGGAGDVVADDTGLHCRVDRRGAVELDVFDAEFFDRVCGTDLYTAPAAKAGAEELVLLDGAGRAEVGSDCWRFVRQTFFEIVGERTEHSGEACGEEASAVMRG